jgi:hypothetical protein
MSATVRIEAARAELEQANARLAELDQSRNAALLADDTATAISLGIELASLKLAAGAHADKIQLLRSLVEKEAAERRGQERARVVEGIEKKLADRDAAGAELADAIKKADVAFRKMVDVGQAIIGLWPWQSPDTHAALLTPNGVATAIMHEIYRVGARPRLFGGQDKSGAGIDFPGGRCPDHRLANLQEKIKPMTAVCAEASALASSIMRTGRSTGYVEPPTVDVAISTNGQGEPPQRTEAEQRLSALLVEMARLAEDPAAEQRYLEVVSEVACTQAEVTAEQKIGAQHG